MVAIEKGPSSVLVGFWCVVSLLWPTINVIKIFPVFHVTEQHKQTQTQTNTNQINKHTHTLSNKYIKIPNIKEFIHIKNISTKGRGARELRLGLCIELVVVVVVIVVVL